MLLLAVTLFAIPRKGLEYVPQNIQLAYIFTKALPRATSETLRNSAIHFHLNTHPIRIVRG